MSIHFTQFLRPDGRRQDVSIDRPKEVEDQAKALVEAGIKLEVEVLMNGVVSFEACFEDSEGDSETWAHELTSNGAGVPETVDKLIRIAHERLMRQAAEACPHCSDVTGPCPAHLAYEASP